MVADRTGTFQLRSGVSVVGGYAGYGAADPDERDVALYETILSGDIGTVDDNSDNSYHVVTGSGIDATAVLDGFTITGGNADAASPYNNGGGMTNISGDPTVANCTFTGNSAIFGGGMSVRGGATANVVNCVFIGNTASAHGGGMLNNGDPVVTDCTFSGNSASDDGGGMANVNASPSVTNCTFNGNSANNGGGIANVNEGSLPTVTNCGFSGNAANYGGGMYNYNNSIPMVTNCTFTGNTAVIYGGGMSNSDSAAATVINCIVWGNTGGQIDYSTDGTATVTYSDVQGGHGGTGNIDSDPLFVDADGADNVAGTTDDDVHLQTTSPCVNAGDPIDAAYLGQADIDTEVRVQQCRVDMGADESYYFRDCNNNTIADECDLEACTGQEWCDDCNGNGILDICDINDCVADPDCDDCNNNDIPDSCDLANSTSSDCQPNAIPDECEADCNTNTIPDDCDIRDCAGDPACGDCNSNTIPDYCDIRDCAGNPDCDDCDTNSIPDFCDIRDCAADPACEDCNTNSIPDYCDLRDCAGDPNCEDCNNNDKPDGCDIDDLTSDDCQPNGVPDECETDCNTNTVPDDCDIRDCAGDSACEDCNNNSIPDSCDLADCTDDPACEDCNDNSVPDECDIDDLTSDDCQPNGVPDDCETDCNTNTVPDDCDIRDCAGDPACDDCDNNSIPDGCDLADCTDDPSCDDCNENDVPDGCDIAGGAPDNNTNGIPDECDMQSPIVADPPHDILKNRYISVDPRGADGLNVGMNCDIRLTLTSTLVNGVTAVGSSWWANPPDADCISIVGPTRPVSAPNWDACSTLHMTGCPIIPTSTYDIVVMDGDTASDPPLVADTQALPEGAKWWGDVVGNFDPGADGWTPPDGLVSINDAVAAIKTFQNPSLVGPDCGTPPCNATHVSVTDVHPAGFPGQPWGTPNQTVDINDVFAIILGFQGGEFPGPDLDQCPD